MNPSSISNQQRVRAKRIAVLLVAASFVSGVASAQTTQPSPVPPEKFMTSPGGVDMRSGVYNYRHTDLSIGGDPGLTLERRPVSGEYAHYEPFSSLSHNWDIFLVERRVEVSTIVHPGFTDYDYAVSIFGDGSASFRSQKNPLSSPSSFHQSSYGDHAKIAFTHATGAFGYRLPRIYTYTAEDGTVINFHSVVNWECGTVDTCVNASDVTKPDGTRYDLIYYGGSGPLQAVVSSRGYALIFEYGSDFGKTGAQLINKACAINLAVTPLPNLAGSGPYCPSGVPTATYGYSTVGTSPYTYKDLTSFTDQSGVASLLGAGLTDIYDAGASTPMLTNTINPVNGVVSAQSFVDGRTYSYSWTLDGNLSPDGTYHPIGGTVTDNNSHTISIVYGQYQGSNPPDDPTMYTTPGPETVTDENGRTLTLGYCNGYDVYSHCILSPAVTRTDPEGILATYTYDSNRNVTQTVVTPKPGSGLTALTSTAGYGCTVNVCANKPTTVTDARGNTTTYTYDTTHGGVLSETGPAVQVNGTGSTIAPIKRYDYTQRYAWISNGSGGYVAAATPVWLLTTEKTCLATATSGTTISDTCAGGSADEVVITYDYGPSSGPNNLLLRGKLVTAADHSGSVVSRRTCYGYDDKGNRIWATSPRAGLGGC